jgi:hypothetical protein
MLREAFLEPLSPAARKGTLFVLLADHGQVDTPPVPEFNLGSHPELLDKLHILPTGENRAAYLHCRPGEGEEARAIERRWRKFVVLSQEAVMRSGLLGRNLDVRTASRLGELLVLYPCRNRAYLWWATDIVTMRSRHGWPNAGRDAGVHFWPRGSTAERRARDWGAGRSQSRRRLVGLGHVRRWRWARHRPGAGGLRQTEFLLGDGHQQLLGRFAGPKLYTRSLNMAATERAVASSIW